AVAGRPALDADADRSNLARADPDAREALASRRFDFVVSQRADHRFLEAAQISMHVATASFQFQNRIADELTGPVIRHLSTARDTIDGNVAGTLREQEALVGAAPEREHV